MEMCLSLLGLCCSSVRLRMLSCAPVASKTCIKEQKQLCRQDSCNPSHGSVDGHNFPGGADDGIELEKSIAGQFQTWAWQ